MKISKRLWYHYFVQNSVGRARPGSSKQGWTCKKIKNKKVSKNHTTDCSPTSIARRNRHLLIVKRSQSYLGGNELLTGVSEQVLSFAHQEVK